MRKDKLYVVPNGYDPEELSRVKPYDFGHFAIVYAGVFRPPVTIVTPVMQALSLLKQRGNTDIVWKFHYFGPHEDHVRDEARKCALMDNIITHGRVTRAEALSAIRGAGVAVVITSVLDVQEHWERGIVTGKLFEPLGMRVPILLVGPMDIDVDDILQTAGLAYKVTPTNIHGMVLLLEGLMSGNVPRARQPEVYAWPNTIRELDNALRDAVINSSFAE